MAAWNTCEAQPSGSETSPTMSPDPYSKPADSGTAYTLHCEEPELVVDGVRMVFQNTPGTEAPAEMNTWFPDLKAFWAAENIVATIHNIYTLRGALVRDPLEWSRQINKALYLFGKDAEVMFASHSWPRWGNDRIQEVMRAQRDTYAHLNNAVLHLANQA